MTLEIKKDLVGSILDVGGGGEAVIGQIYGDRVIAIDISQEELDEAPDCCEKRLMDATELSFPDLSFDNVTFFYSLMYMARETQCEAIAEAARVLKIGGSMCIWDSDIRSAFPEPHSVNLEIISGQIKIHTSYGIVKEDTQDSCSILQILKSFDLNAEHVVKKDAQFYIRCKKE